jgi:hypothetical protein
MQVQLITRELWHGLNNALPRHPLLWYPLRHQDTHRGNPNFWIEFIPSMMLVVAVVGALLLWAAYGIPPLTLILLLDAYAGVVVTRGVTAAMHRARERGLLELMGVTPSGQMGAVWALMTRYLRRDPTLAGLHQAASWLHVTWLFALLPFGALVMITLCGSASISQTEFGLIFNQPLALLNGIVIFGVMIMDYLAALVAGALTGMIVPAYAPARTDLAFLAPIAFLGVQVATYVLLLLVHLVLISVLSVPGWLSGWSSSVAFLVAYIGVREATLWVLCAVLAWRMNTSVRDVLTIHRRSL